MKQSLGADRLRPLRGTSLGLTILIMALWGGNAVAVSFSVDTLPPVAVAGIRFAMGTAFMVVYCRWEGTSLSATRRELYVAFIAGFLLFIQISSFNIGVVMTNSSHGAMLINTFVFWVAAIEHFFTRTDRLTARSIAGLVVSAIGVGFVMMPGDITAQIPQSFLIGDVILLASAVLLAIRVVYVRHVVGNIAPSKLIFWHNIFGVVMFAAWSLLTESFENVSFTRAAILGLLYQGVVVAGFCFALHASLLRNHSASQISVFSFTAPVFGVIFSILLRNEPFTAYVVLGVICVAFGIWLVCFRR